MKSKPTSKQTKMKTHYKLLRDIITPTSDVIPAGTIKTREEWMDDVANGSIPEGLFSWNKYDRAFFQELKHHELTASKAREMATEPENHSLKDILAIIDRYARDGRFVYKTNKNISVSTKETLESMGYEMRAANESITIISWK